MASKITHPIMSSNYFSVVLFFLSAWLVGFFLFSPRIVINSVVLLVFFGCGDGQNFLSFGFYQMDSNILWNASQGLSLLSLMALISIVC